MELRNDSSSPFTSLAATMLAASFLLSCQQDAGLDANAPAPPVALAPRITVAPEDTAFFNRTEWVFVEIQAGSMEHRTWVDFDSGRYVFQGVPANTNYTLSFDGYLDDKKTRVWSATRSGRTGTTRMRELLPAAMAPTPLVTQSGTSFTGSDKPFSTPQTIEIWTRGVDTVYYRQGEESPKVYAGGPLKLDRSGDLYVWSRRNGETVATVSIPYQYIPGTTEKAANPTIAPSGGALHEADLITIDVSAGAFDSIQYSIDSTGWTRYRNSFPVGTASTTGKIFARTIRGSDTSSTTKASYLILAPRPVPTPDTTEFDDTARILIRASGADSVDYQFGGLPLRGRKGDTITAVLTASGTIEVRSYKSGLTPDTLKRYIEINQSTLPATPEPVFDAPNDTLDKPGLVGIHADGADYIKVWVEGASDTTAKTIYGSDGTWMVSSAGRVYAKAYRNGFAPSVNWRNFVLRGPGAIRFTPQASSFTDSQTIVVESPNADTLVIRIGGRPEKVYTSSSVQVFIDTTTRLDVRARRNGMDVIASRDITILPPRPLLEPASDTFEILDTVKISSPRGDLVTYTLDGSKWDTVQGFFKLLPITKNETIRAKAWRGGTSSDVVEGRFTVIPRLPSFDITRDTFGLAIDVTIHAASPADSLEYSIDGGAWMLAPASSKTLSIAKTQTVSARALKNGERSAAIARTYVIDPPEVPWTRFNLTAVGTGYRVVFYSQGCDSMQVSLRDPSLATEADWVVLRSTQDSLVQYLSSNAAQWYRAVKHGVASAPLRFALPITDFGVPWHQLNSFGHFRYSTFTDPRDGRGYKLVVIGGRAWLAQNLNYSGDGTVGQCFDSCEKYGRMYSWAEAMGLPAIYDTKLYDDSTQPVAGQQGVCPVGFHLPTAEDIDSLYAAASRHGSTAATLKSSAGWFEDAWNGTDTLGFRLLPAGGMIGGVTLGTPGTAALLVTSDQVDSTHARSFSVLTYQPGAYWRTTAPDNYQLKSDKRSVRCVQNSTK